jgi:uncharacterized membrane protein
VRIRLSALAERLRSSLFFVPMLAVLAAIGGGIGMIAIDANVDAGGGPSFGIASTVESARSLLSTIAGATISFAGIAFSVSLLIIQLASSQYSPRVVHTLFRDPFNKRVMALVVGTFTYCLMVLRSVRDPLEEGGNPVIPSLSVAVAVVLGVATILAIVAFINHSAHSMDVSEVLERIRGETVAQVRNERREDATDSVEEPERFEFGPDAWTARFDQSGWVQIVDADALLRCLPEGSTARLETLAGRYAVEGTALCSVARRPDDVEQVERDLRATVRVGSTRTMQQDASYGLRQLVDVALKALSPGINDPTTAQDAIFHTSAVLGELLRSEPRSRHRTAPGDRHLWIARQPTGGDLVSLAFDEVRRAAAVHPRVCIYLLEAIDLLVESLIDAGHDRDCPELRRQARSVVASAAAAAMRRSDARIVRDAYEQRFGRDATEPGSDPPVRVVAPPSG